MDALGPTAAADTPPQDPPTETDIRRARFRHVVRNSATIFRKRFADSDVSSARVAHTAFRTNRRPHVNLTHRKFQTDHREIRAIIQQDTMLLHENDTPRTMTNNMTAGSLRRSDRSLTEPTMLPPIESKKVSSRMPITSRTGGDTINFTSASRRTPRKLKLPLPPKFALYRKIGLVDNASKCKKSEDEDMRKETQPVKEAVTARVDYVSHLRERVRPQRPEKARPNAATIALKNGIPLNLRGKEADVAYSIRQKIAQFKQWHQENYKHSLEKLRLKDSGSVEEGDDTVVIANLYREYLKNKKKQDVNEGEAEEVAPHAAPVTPVSPGNALPRLNTKGMVHVASTNGSDDKESRDSAPARAESPPAKVPDELLQRTHSARTWRTWRDVNESYAYTDVKTYIRDNDLMTEEKSQVIREWVSSVERARAAGQSRDLGVPPLRVHMGDNS